MALASRSLKSFQNIKSVFYVTQQKKLFLNGPNLSQITSRPYAKTVGSKPKDENLVKKRRRDPAPYFFNDEVQSLLLDMNMRDTSKVFQPRKEGDFPEPELKFLTQDELEQEQLKAAEMARYYLQLPPVLLEKEETTRILSKDPALQGLEDSKLLITDISFGIPHRDRIIAAREPDGTLRHATTDERSRMIQTYFPESCRSYETPELFSSSNLESLLERSEFEFILDRACIQFEPDDQAYVSITSKTYNYIDQNGKYDDLVGTRHYGSMAFYLAFHGTLDRFLKHCISTFKIQDAVAAVRVFYLTNPETGNIEKPSASDDIEFLKKYISQHSKDKATLSMTLNSYLEFSLPTEAEAASK